MRRFMIAFIMAPLLCAAAGCANDPYSQHRIKEREESMRGLAGDIGKLEQHRAARLREVEPSLKKWWRDDVKLWQERSPTVGDYLW